MSDRLENAKRNLADYLILYHAQDEAFQLLKFIFEQIESLTNERDGLQLQFDAMIVFKNDWKDKSEKFEAENADLKESSNKWQDISRQQRSENDELIKGLAASEKEVQSVVTEINSIKSERNAVIKAHADLLAECQELKTQLKFLEARLEK